MCIRDRAETDSSEEAGSTEPDDTKTNEPNAADTDETELEKLRSEFATAQATYKADAKAYDDRQKRIKYSKQKAERLNRRFAKWYYVISGSSYDNLALDRSTLVAVKPAPTETETKPETEPTEETGTTEETETTEEADGTSVEESSPENQADNPEQKASEPEDDAELS